MRKPKHRTKKPDRAAALTCEPVSREGFLPRRAELLILAGLVTVAVACTHWPVLQARALTYDDQMYLTDNPLVQQPSWASAGRFLKEVWAPSTVQGYYQPLAMISLMLDYAVAGSTDNLTPFHATSLILHLANTLLIMWLLYALFHRPWIAAAVALLFGVHPLTVEPIAWVGERKTLLAAFFSLLCILVYIRYTRRGGWKLYTISAAIFVLALMSKPTSTPLPLVLLLMDYWPLRRLSKKSAAEKIPFLLMAMASAIITMMSQRHLALLKTHILSIGQSFLLMCHNLMFYPSKMIWPTKLSSFYPFPENISLSNPLLLTYLVACLVLVVLLLISLRRTRALLVGWLCFFLLLAPTLLNTSYSPSVAWDKYTYLPAIGYLLLLAWLFDSVAGRSVKGKPTWREAVLGVGILAIAGLLAVGTRSYLQEWQTKKRHNYYMLSLSPNSPYAHNDYGNSLVDEGNFTEAIKHYNQAIERSPRLVSAWFNRGYAYERLGKDTKARENYNKAIALDPNNPRFARAYNNCGAICDRRGNYEQAIQNCTKAIELKPEYAEAYVNRASAYRHMHDLTKAINDYNRAIELKPDLAAAYNNRGNAYLKANEFDRAISDYTKAIKLQPDLAEAYNNRGNCYNRLEDYQQALQDYTKAIELKPDYAEAYANRADVYVDLEEFFHNKENLHQAIREYSKAIELKPDYSNAYYNRAIAYHKLEKNDKALEDLKQCKRTGGRPSPDVVKSISRAAVDRR